MQDIISAAILIATLYCGTLVAEKIHYAVREAALVKTAEGLPKLSTFSQALTSHQRNKVRCTLTQPERSKL